MPSQSPFPPSEDRELWDTFQGLKDDPLACIRYGFRWRKAGTPLADFPGPKVWHCEEFEAIKDFLVVGRRVMAVRTSLKHELDELEKAHCPAAQLAELRHKIKHTTPPMYKFTLRSGNGGGKSAFAGLFSWWFKTVWTGSTVTVTANKADQLASKTMPEINKWFGLSLNAHWWDCGAMKIQPQPWLSAAITRDLSIKSGIGSWDYLLAQPWSKENPDAMAGAHNWNGMAAILDEASNIADAIWDVVDGTYTEPIINRFQISLGNPRRVTGAFYRSHTKEAKLYRTRHLDVRNVEDTDPAAYQRIIDRNGPNSYQARVQVYGEFPTLGEKQWISHALVEGAQDRELVKDDAAPLILGVDPARFGDDSTTLYFRRGRDARSIPPVVLQGYDTQAVAKVVIDNIEQHNPDAVACDEGGLGAGVVDALRHAGVRVVGVQFGEAPIDSEYADNRTKLWADMRDWLPGGCIDPNNERLEEDLVAPDYTIDERTGKIRLQSKRSLKDDGHPSPDHGDGLCLTFAPKLLHRARKVSRVPWDHRGQRGKKRPGPTCQLAYRVLP